MKTVAGVVGLLVFCAGCVSETGVNYEETVDLHYSVDTLDVTPLFSVKKPKLSIVDQGRDAIVGRWRFRLNKDYIIFKDRDTLRKNGDGGKSSQWEIYEYEFGVDGTYRMRGVAKDGKSKLVNVGEDGKWTYIQGVLHLQSEWFLSSGLFPFSEPKRTEWKAKNVDYHVTWNSEREFTLEFECQDAKRLPICDYVVTSVGLGMKGSCGDPLFDRMPVPAQNGHYDENGCFYFQGRCCFGEVSVVVGPVQCKRVGK